MKILKILVAEDDPIQAYALISMLQQQGHEVVGKARSGERALQLFEETVPDLVVLDINLTGRINNGIEAGHLMAEKRNVPLVFLSGYPEFLGHPQLPNDTVFFPKPFNENDLRRALETAWQLHYQNHSSV